MECLFCNFLFRKICENGNSFPLIHVEILLALPLSRLNAIKYVYICIYVSEKSCLGWTLILQAYKGRRWGVHTPKQNVYVNLERLLLFK